jgi:dTDP-4-dehydrorhamnose 3,5-epimerase-like enzyme
LKCAPGLRWRGALACGSEKQTAFTSLERMQASCLFKRGIAWNDPGIAIEWPLPLGEVAVSERDQDAPTLSDVAQSLPFSFGADSA